MTTSLMPVPRLQFFQITGTFAPIGSPLSGGAVYTYLAGTNTAVPTYTDSTGSVQNPWPLILDSAGTGSLWISGYVKVSVYDAGGTLQFTQDNVSSMPNTSLNIAQWITQTFTPTYVSATQFSGLTDLTATFQTGRRIQAAITSGTLTGTVVTAATSGSPLITTVTVIWDSGALDTSLTSIAVAALSVLSPSIPIRPVNSQTANYSMALTDINTPIVFNSANAVTLTMIAANVVPSGAVIPVKNVGAGQLTLSEPVDGLANQTLYQYNGVDLFSDGANWMAKNSRSTALANTGNASNNSTIANSSSLAQTANITVTAGDIIFVQSLSYLRTAANGLGNFLNPAIQTSGTGNANYIWINGHIPNSGLDYRATGTFANGDYFGITLSGIAIYTGSGNSGWQNSISMANGNGASANNYVGYMFLYKQ